MNIILCATQRCGSTLIVEDMRNTGVLGQPEEWFISWQPEKTHLNWAQVLTSVNERAAGENGVAAVKVMANQLFAIEECLSTTVATKKTGDFPHFAATFEDSQFVWLTRRDIVSQAISRIMSRQTGVNHATGNSDDAHFAGNLAKGYDPSYNKNTKYSYGEILQQVTAITLENLAWKRFFESHGTTPVELVYEEVILDDNMGHLDVFAEMARLKERPIRQPRKMVKVGNQENKNWCEQFFLDAAKNRFCPVESSK